MAKTPVTINIDNTVLAQASAALAWKAGWVAQVTDTDPNSATYGQQIANPITQLQAAKQRLINIVQSDIADYSAMQAQTSATTQMAGLIS